MEETTQEQPDSNLTTPQIEEDIDNKKPEIEKTDSVETEEAIPEQVEEITEDLHSENEHEKSDSECSDQSGGESDDASVVLEREEGDGQESTPNRKVDDDEDKRNPQYIPKRGTFYEHDDRTAVDEEGEESEKPENERLEKDASKKKVWSEKEGSKWSHDRFNDQEQAPKSRSELVAIYGYDIRNEEGPPRARRRRRYGRGPNKYTRNWEDEEAYSKPTNVQAKPPPRKPRRARDGEEFPPLGGGGSGGGSISDAKSPEPSDPIAGGDSLENNETPLSKSENIGSGDYKPQSQHLQYSENGGPSPRNAHTAGKPQRGGMRSGPRREESSKIPPVNNNSRGVTKTRGFPFKNCVRTPDATRARNQKNQQRLDEEYSDYILSQNFTNKAHNPDQPQQQGVQKLEKDMANMSMQHQEFSGPEGGGSGNGNRGGKFGGSNTRQTSVPPRLQGEQRGSKRYSSLRQRSLPETASNPQFGQHPQFYQAGEFSTEYSGPPVAGQTGGGAGLLPHPPASAASVPLNGAAHVIQGPPFAPPYPPAPPAAFLQSVQPPVQPFLPQQPPPPPQIINFAQPPPQPYPPPTFTNFQHQQFNPVNQAQPTELYQPQGGITYYSTQNQQVLPRVPQKRVKSAIPIVPPPEHREPRGRGRLSHGEDSPVGGPPEGHMDEPLPHEAAATAPVIVQQ